MKRKIPGPDNLKENDLNKCFILEGIKNLHYIYFVALNRIESLFCET